MAHKFRERDLARCKAEFLACPVILGHIYLVTRVDARNDHVWVVPRDAVIGGSPLLIGSMAMGPYPASWFELAPGPRGMTNEEIGLLTTDPRFAHIETPLLAEFAREVEGMIHGTNDELREALKNLVYAIEKVGEFDPETRVGTALRAAHELL